MAKYFLYNVYSGVDTFSAFPAGDEFSFDTSNFNPQFTFSKDDIIVCYSNPGLFYVLKIVDIKDNAIKVFKSLEFFNDIFIAFDSGINIKLINVEEYNNLLGDFFNNFLLKIGDNSAKSNVDIKVSNLISQFAKWLNANPKHNYYENDYNKTLQGLERINDKYKESFGDDLFVVNVNELDSKVESINTNIWDKDSTFWTFSETTSTHLPRAILNKENFQRFLKEYSYNKELKNSNTIYYGAPGTGKSYKVDQIIKDLDKQFYERVTFHPEYDNASFIGGYKPISEKDEEGKDVIKYEFVPQAFANIYKRAWQDLDNQYYLVIEEINRGNCAEIFGELFQLLDRNSGYTITPSNELYTHLVEEFGDENHKGIIKGLQLPPNLAILATMNTSDQSLFPMDSAFKRRWEWEYVPICYDEVNEEGGENKSYNFVIDLGNGSQYSWIKFIEYINFNHIKENPNLGMDKCIGNYFVKPEKGNSISLKQFINKVIFYLWNDVFKDEDNAVFEENSSYEDFFPTNSKGLVKVTELFERIGLEKNDPEKKSAKKYPELTDIKPAQLNEPSN